MIQLDLEQTMNYTGLFSLVRKLRVGRLFG
jgi:hypothetical protein